MLLQHYEEILRELEEIEINLDDKSINEIRESLRSIVSRGWVQIETMFGAKNYNKHTKKEIQEHFNAMLNVVPITRVKRKNDKT